MTASLIGIVTTAEMMGNLLVRLQTKTRTASAAPLSSTLCSSHTHRYVTPGKSRPTCSTRHLSLYKMGFAAKLISRSWMGLVPMFCKFSLSLKSGPSPCTCAVSRIDSPRVYDWGPWPSVSTLTYARAVLSRSLHRSRWKMRCISVAWSRSRCVCSTYSFVFFGIASGMSCSGGGPGGALAESSAADRCSILMSSVPALPTMASAPSSRPYDPKRMPTMGSSTVRVCTRSFSLYTRTSPLCSETSRARSERMRVTESTSTAATGAGMYNEKLFFPLM
mmetsp:Transcript_9655/g.24975  ORF Transcript_9655/g.24975 Transcript_9655/m.24975 type:complete len:277 (-) Transcript_9655:866-1696(-)